MGRILGFIGVLISAGIVFYLYTKQAQSVASIGGGERGEFIVELQIDAHARRAQAADQAAQRLLDLPPALLLVLHFPQRVAVLFFPIRFGHEAGYFPLVYRIRNRHMCRNL